MTIEIGAGLSLLISVSTLLGLGVTVVAFFMKIKWDSHQHEKEIAQLKDDLNNVGSKVDKKYDDLVHKLTEQTSDKNDQIKTLLVRVDSMDKMIVAMTVEMKFMVETVKELKERLFNSTAVK